MTFDLAWTSDLRFDRLSPAGRSAFLERLEARRPNALLVAGDIATGSTLAAALQWLGETGIRTYIALGNREGWGTGFAKARGIAHDTCRRFPLLTYLSTAGVVQLAPDTALVGADGWYDARLGKADGAVAPPDFLRNPDLVARQSRDERLQWVRMWADYGAQQLLENLTIALERHTRVVVATHVPPWQCDARARDPKCAPWLVHHALGMKLREVAKAHRPSRIFVVCGHVRVEAPLQVEANLTCHAYPGTRKQVGVHLSEERLPWE